MTAGTRPRLLDEGATGSRAGVDEAMGGPARRGARGVRGGRAGGRLRRLPDAAGVRRTRRDDHRLAPASRRRSPRSMAPADAALARGYPGDRRRQPVHTVYVPADRFADLAARSGAAPGGARRARTPGPRRRRGVDRAPWRRRGRWCAPSWRGSDRGSPRGLRGRVRRPAGRRGGRRRPGGGRVAVARPLPRHIGLRFKSLEAPTRRAACARSTWWSARLVAAGCRPASRSRCRRSPRSTRCGDGEDVWRLEAAYGLAPAACASRSRSRPGRRCSARTGPRPSRG